MSYIKLSGSVLAASSSAAGTYELGVSEFQMLDGLAAGTVAASKLVVVDSNKDIKEFRNLRAVQLSASSNIVIGNADLNETDLEKLDGIINGHVTGSKAVVVDSNKDASGFRNVSGSGALQFASLHCDSVNLDGGTIEGTDITVGTGKTLSVSAGTLTTSAAQNLAIMQGAAANVDLGDYDLRAQTLTADSLTSGRVPFAGANGVLQDDTDFTFSGDTLTVTKLGAFEAAGAINFANQDMTNVDIDSGAIDGTVIGAASQAPARFSALTASSTSTLQGVTATTISGSGAANLASLHCDSVNLDGGSMDGVVIGAETTAAASVTTIAASGLANLDGGIEVDNGGNKFVVSTTGLVSAAGAISSSVGVAADGTSTLAGGGGFLHIGNGYQGGSGTGMSLSSAGVLNMKGALTVDSHAVIKGNVELGDNTSDTITATGRFASDLVPSGDSARDLGTSALQWAALHVDVANIDQLASALDCNNQAMTNVDINSGAIDGTTLGAASAASAKVTSLSSSAGMAITAGSGPYSLSIADGAGDAIAQAWVTHSDRNLKTNIQELDNDAALNAVMSLQPSTYEKKATGKSEIGFIAQEVAQVVPEICALDANGEGRGIDYSRMSTLLAGALKAQQEQIAQLKEIVAKLQK